MKLLLLLLKIPEGLKSLHIILLMLSTYSHVLILLCQWQTYPKVKGRVSDRRATLFELSFVLCHSLGKL